MRYNFRMKTKPLTFLLSLTFLFLFSSSSVVFADTAINYTVKSKMAWSAFECAVLGSFDKSKPTEALRLFNIGYKETKDFIVALKEKKLNDENFDKDKMPLFFQFFVGASPSIDFYIGRLYEFVAGLIYDEIEREINNDKLFLDLKFKQKVAARFFLEKNCQLIGLE